METGVTPGDAHPTAWLAVSDTGAGIPADVLPKLSEPFFTTKPGHLGLGLAISRDIAAKHQGLLSLSNRPGGGAKAVLELPATGPEPA